MRVRVRVRVRLRVRVRVRLGLGDPSGLNRMYYQFEEKYGILYNVDRYMIDIEPNDSFDSFSKQIANGISSAADKGIPLCSLNKHKNENYPENILQLIRYKKFLQI